MKPKYLSVITLGALALVMPASADVIYSNLQNIEIPATFDGLYLNLETGAWNTPSNLGAGVTGWDINPFFGGRAVANSPDFQPVRSGTASDSPIVNLAADATVGSGSVFSTFLQGPTGETPGAPGYGGSQMLTGSGGNFTAGTEGYLGFKLNGTDYGWMRVVFTNNNTGAFIKDWAYNTGGTIATGNVIQSGSTYTLDSTVQSFALGSAIAGSNNLIKNGANTVTLNADNTFSGTTSINTGTLAIGSTGTLANTSTITVGSGAALDVTAVGGGWTLGASQALTGSGGVTGNVTIAGTHNAGDPASNNGVGSQAITGDLTYATGSIFEWDINQSSTSTGFDTVSATTVTADSGSIFHVVLGPTVMGDLGTAFWNSAPYATQTWSMADIFGQSLSGGFGSVTTSNNVSTYGSFTINGTHLTWTAVPEPTSALAGLLIGAGLLRRRRAGVSVIR